MDSLEMKAAGFGRRLLAHGVDLLIFIPLAKLIYPDTRAEFFSTQVLVSLIGYVYFFYFYSRFGQTVGKMMAGVKIVKLNGEPIGFFETLKRKSVDIGLEIARIGATAFVLFASAEDQFQQIPIDQRIMSIYTTTPLLMILMTIWGFWAFADAIILFFNPQKRAAHDFIAGTRAIIVPSLLKRFSEGSNTPSV
jgi:uncharacterized RDD family membrane protein YckC